MIYADYAATSPLDPEVLTAMLPYFSETFGNGTSLHTFGREAARAVEAARETVAQILGAEKREIYFTSGGTESDNWAIRGTVGDEPRGLHVITSAIEHHAILETLAHLEKQGLEVTYLPVDSMGRVKPEDVKNAIKSNTVLISVMTANNEIGTVEPIREIGLIARAAGIPFHTDAVQAAGTLDLDVRRDGVDMLSLSAHKFFGPKGVGVLYIRDGLHVKNLTFGGSQERDRRPGTLNTPGIVGLAAALKKQALLRGERESITKERAETIKKTVLAALPETRLNGDPVNRLPGNVSFFFPGIQAEGLLLLLDMKGIACSAGAACSAGTVSVSHVLKAIRGEEAASGGTIRLSVCHLTTEREAQTIAKTVVETVRQLKEKIDR